MTCKGFYQYQSVVPFENARNATKKMLKIIADSGNSSFLTVLKNFGKKKSLGMLSFPIYGVTLAIDFHNKGQKTLTLFKNLDKIVTHNGGRIYPAKDSRMSSQTFKTSFPKYEEFKNYIDTGITSDFAKRVLDKIYE